MVHLLLLEVVPLVRLVLVPYLLEEAYLDPFQQQDLLEALLPEEAPLVPPYHLEVVHLHLEVVPLVHLLLLEVVPLVHLVLVPYLLEGVEAFRHRPYPYPEVVHQVLAPFLEEAFLVQTLDPFQSLVLVPMCLALLLDQKLLRLGSHHKVGIRP